MKSFFVAATLLLSGHSFAQYVNVYPMVYNLGNSVQVQVNNSTDDLIYCSGSIMMMTQFNRTEYQYYSEYVVEGAVSSRMYYLQDFSDRITFTNNFINCIKA